VPAERLITGTETATRPDSRAFASTSTPPTRPIPHTAAKQPRSRKLEVLAAWRLTNTFAWHLIQEPPEGPCREPRTPNHPIVL